MYENWIEQENHPPRYIDYSISAHELAHILTDAGQNSHDGNILCGQYNCKGKSTL